MEELGSFLVNLKELKSFLGRKLDVFAWKHKDMVGTNQKVICHHFKIDPRHGTNKQTKEENPQPKKV